MTSSPEIAATIIPINNGQYLATYNVSVTGTYLTNVFVDGVAISGSPYPTKVTRCTYLASRIVVELWPLTPRALETHIHHESTC